MNPKDNVSYPEAPDREGLSDPRCNWSGLTVPAPIDDAGKVAVAVDDQIVGMQIPMAHNRSRIQRYCWSAGQQLSSRPVQKTDVGDMGSERSLRDLIDAIAHVVHPSVERRYGAVETRTE